MAFPPLTVRRLTTRWFFVFFALAATYNPSGYSYYNWVTGKNNDYLSLKIACGIFLLTFYGAVWPIIYTSIGPIGIFMTSAFLITGSLVMWDYGFLDHITPSFYPWGIMGGMAFVACIGLGFAHWQLQFWHIKSYRKVTVKRYPAYSPPGPAPVPPGPPTAPPPII
ncbi:MAG: DUF6524 family protein [Rhodospirillaceae bacterium]